MVYAHNHIDGLRYYDRLSRCNAPSNRAAHKQDDNERARGESDEDGDK